MGGVGFSRLRLRCYHRRSAARGPAGPGSRRRDGDVRRLSFDAGSCRHGSAWPGSFPRQTHDPLVDSPMIDYRCFSKRYSDVLAVEPLSLAVEEGETLALVGPNGSGKTTLLKGAAGLVRATAGHVVVAGHDVATDGREARRAVGYMPQRLGFPEGA